jgi:hypothetical protein
MMYVRLLALLLLLQALGCTSRVCTADLRVGLFVVVEGTVADDDVSVVAQSADHSEELICSFSEGAHDCSGLQERPGTYVVTATINGVGEEQSVTLDHDGCHVVPQTITFTE